jgi:methionyl-tRNA formyltransferase
MSRLAFLGTPELAVPPLVALHEAGHEIAVVVTRADRRRGRGSALVPSPVKSAASALGLEVTDRIDDVVSVGAELGVVVAFGRLIPGRVLDQVPMVNLHFSLLPRWRGAAPVERAILAGDPVTGVCVMALEEALDTGPVYRRVEVPIGPGEHLGPLRDRLVAVGTDQLVELLADGPAGLGEPVPQVGEPTYADKIAPEELALDFSRPAEQLWRVVRLDRAWTTFRGRRLRIVQAEVAQSEGAQSEGAQSGAAGTLVGDEVVAGGGRLRLVVVQPEGRSALAAPDWLRGARPEPGERLGIGPGPHRANPGLIPIPFS